LARSACYEAPHYAVSSNEYHNNLNNILRHHNYCSDKTTLNDRATVENEEKICKILMVCVLKSGWIKQIYIFRNKFLAMELKNTKGIYEYGISCAKSQRLYLVDSSTPEWSAFFINSKGKKVKLSPCLTN
jgi:hypothetical protein